MENHT